MNDDSPLSARKEFGANVDAAVANVSRSPGTPLVAASRAFRALTHLTCERFPC